MAAVGLRWGLAPWLLFLNVGEGWLSFAQFGDRGWWVLRGDGTAWKGAKGGLGFLLEVP